MKKSIILFATSFLLFLAGNQFVKAQETVDSKFGIKGGVNYSGLYTEESEDTRMLAGFNIGLYGKIPVTNNFAVQPELYYTTKGAEVTYNNDFVDGTARFRLNYLELPLLFVINLTENFNVHFGPYAAYMISGKATNESNVSLFDFEDNIDVEDYNRFDAGLAAGAAIDMGGLSLGARYNYGLTKVGKEKTFMGTTYTFPDASNGVLNVYLSLSMN